MSLQLVETRLQTSKALVGALLIACNPSTAGNETREVRSIVLQP